MTSDVTASSFDDAEITRRLVGTWISEPKDGLDSDGASTYNADGSGSEFFNMMINGEAERVDITTKWSIENGMLNLLCLSSTQPNVVPAGMKLQNKIVSISDDKYEFELLGTPLPGTRFTKLRVG